jgi:hypothetical protein
VLSLSSPTFSGDRRLGRPGVAILQNLLFHSNRLRDLFLGCSYLPLFYTLYNELTDSALTQRILWLIQNCLRITPAPPLDAVAPVVELLQPVFGYGVRGAEAAEIGLCCAEYAVCCLTGLEIANLCESFAFLAAQTQVEAFRLFAALAAHQDREVAAWTTKSVDKKVQKAFLVAATAVLERHLLTINGDSDVSVLFPIVFALVEQRILPVRVLAIRPMGHLVHAASAAVLELIMGQKLIARIVAFLESDWTMLLSCALELLLYIVGNALEGKCMRKILGKVADNDVQEKSSP